MANVFNAAEIIDMGIEKEKKRRDFYALAAKRFTQPKLSEMFARLAAWEETHIAKFTEIRNATRLTEVTESYAGEFGLYIRSLVDDLLYDQVSPDAFAKNVATTADAFRYAIAFEKDAILFFTELLSYMEPENRDAVNALVEEEKKHIIYLAGMQREIA